MLRYDSLLYFLATILRHKCFNDILSSPLSIASQAPHRVHTFFQVVAILLLFAVFSSQDQLWACCLVQWPGTVLWFLTRPLPNKKLMRLCQSMWITSHIQLGVMPSQTSCKPDV